MIGTPQDIRLPKAQDAVAAGAHVRVLRCVEAHAPLLARIGHVELVRVAVPVIPVELDDESSSGNERVDGEPTPDEVLSEEHLAGLCEHAVSDGLNPSLCPSLLSKVHRQQHLPALRVGVAARKGAVEAADARRCLEGGAADGAGAVDLAAGGPFVGVLSPAEVSRAGTKPVLRDVDGRATDAARDAFAGLPLRLRSRGAARRGAEPLSGAEVAGLLLAATVAPDRSDLVPELTLHRRSMP